MGFSHSWIAVRGLDPTVALEVIGMAAGRELGPGAFPKGLAMGQLPGGWLLVLSSHFEDAFKRLAVLASHGPAVACAVEEHVMYSEARGYKDGIEVWRVVSDCERDDDQITVTGDPPARFNAIHLAAKQEQAADGDGDDSADYLFDVPPQVAEAVCGFRLGEPDPEGLRFIDLRKVSGSAPAGGGGRPGFFARLFGRR